MRLLQSVLPTLHQTKKPQQKFVAHLLGLLLLLPGHATFRNLSRYSSYHERTFARWYARDFDFVALNKVAITAVIPPEHAQALVIDASFVPKSGKKTYGLDRFWNGSHRVVYLSPADKYHRLTRRLSQRAKRPKRESSHGLSAALSPLVTPSKPAVRTHVAGSGSLSLPLPTTVACSYPH